MCSSPGRPYPQGRGCLVPVTAAPEEISHRRGDLNGVLSEPACCGILRGGLQVRRSAAIQSAACRTVDSSLANAGGRPGSGPPWMTVQAGTCPGDPGDVQIVIQHPADGQVRGRVWAGQNCRSSGETKYGLPDRGARTQDDYYHLSWATLS